MGDLLIHSLSEFSDLLADGIRIAASKRIVEIGAEFGGTTSLLAALAAEAGGELVSIDPAPKPEYVDWCAANPAVRHIADLSLNAVPTLGDVDVWVIDGDHNWFTVFHELKAIDALCRRDGKPLLCFMHDVAWPAGRRDQYYTPAQIPAEHRQPCDYEGGAVPGQKFLAVGRGFRGMGHFAWAAFEGGPKNGVKTAIEDFVEQANDGERQLAYAEVPAVFGLGILFDLSAPWADELANLLVPYHQNKLLAKLEQNRLANYLAVIDWQDRWATEQAKVA